MRSFGAVFVAAYALLFCIGLITVKLLFTRNFQLASAELGCALLVLIVVVQQIQTAKSSLTQERDILETRVRERTQELEDAQLSRNLELQRFAEFGRLSAHLLHDLTNPLTAASLNLQLLGKHESEAIKQAQKSLRQLERYVQAARKQLREGSSQVTFNVQSEIKQLMAVLKPLATKAGVTIVVQQETPVKLYGDPVRFNQIIANLTANAIDAYACTTVAPQNKRVVITVKDSARFLHITVCDYGKGITALQLPQIFEPFYTTKHDAIRGLGIGLSIVKRSVREDFNGTICVNSSKLHGTTFTVLLRKQLPEQPSNLAIAPLFGATT